MPRIFMKAREPFSSYSHFVGAVISIIGLITMLVRLMIRESASAETTLSVIIFCLSLIALYSASSIYHFCCGAEGTLSKLKKLDHSMIYVLIAGTYTPIILCYMEKPAAYAFLGVIWIVAFAGIAIKLLWIDAPRILGTMLYLILGWSIVLRFDTVLRMPPAAFVFLAAGGIAYTIGGIIYMIKKPNINAILGFHELFHLFVITGSFFHYMMVFLYIL